MSCTDIPHLRWLLERQLNWISAADAKLAVLGPLPLAMLTFSLVEFDLKINDLSSNDLPLILSTTLLLLSLGFSIAALTSRLDGPKTSSIFFGRIAERERTTFAKDLGGCGADEIVADLLAQIHTNASIAKIKHQNVSRATLSLVFAMPIWLVAISKV